MVSQKGYGAVLFDEWVPDSNYNECSARHPFDFGFGAVTNALIRGSGLQMTYFMPQITIMIILMKQAHHFIISARDGNDELFAGGGMTTLYGGWGDDIFHISSEAQQTVVVGDVAKSTRASDDVLSNAYFGYREHWLCGRCRD